MTKPVDINGNRSVNPIVADWTESELMYFPRSPRVMEGAEADPLLESSIQNHFETVKELHNVSKMELAKVARFEGRRLMYFIENGSEADDTIINSILRVEDELIASHTLKPKVIRRAEDVTGPLVSLGDINLGEAPPSRSALLPGLFIIYGGADSSKSYRLKKLADLVATEYTDFDSEYVVVGEPDHRSVGSWKETISILRYGFIDNGEIYVPDVLFVDSLKDLLYMPGDSGSGSGGLSTAAIMELSSISSQLMRDGRTVVAVINPSQPKYMDDMFETLKSNVTGVFYYNPSVKTKNANSGVDNFTPKSVGKLISSIRKWNESYYQRNADVQIMELLGLTGDILDVNTTPGKTIVTRKSTLLSGRTVETKGLKDRMRRLLVGSTPANRE